MQPGAGGGPSHLWFFADDNGCWFLPSLYRSIMVKKVIGSFFTNQSTFPPSSRGVLGMSHLEETPGRTPDMLELLCHSAGQDCPGILLDVCGEMSGERKVWASLHRLLPLSPDTWKKRDEWTNELACDG